MVEMVAGLQDRVASLAAEAGELVSASRHEEAIAVYRAALDATERGGSITTCLLAAIGDAAFRGGMFDVGAEALAAAVAAPGGDSDPFIRLRLGQCELETGRLGRAAEHLRSAYAAGGAALFEAEHPRYLAFLEGRIVPLVCGPR